MAMATPARGVALLEEQVCERDVAGLKRQLLIERFRDGQLDIIRALALEGRDAWVSLPCGGGKSLIFAGALLLLRGVGILVEPLQAITALMLPYLRHRGIDAVELTAKTRGAVLERLRAYQRTGKDKGTDMPPLAIVAAPVPARPRPVPPHTRVSACAARTLNAMGQSRVTLSPREEHLRASCRPRQGRERSEMRPKRFSQAARTGLTSTATTPSTGAWAWAR